jgi:hypothetical protein
VLWASLLHSWSVACFAVYISSFFVLPVAASAIPSASVRVVWQAVAKP